MGWNAYTKNLTENQKRVFEEESERALKRVQQEVGSKENVWLDGALKDGALSWRDCNHFLHRALEWYNLDNPDYASCYDQDGWSAKKVQELNRAAVWKMKYEKEEASAYWSARTFLKTCASLNLPVYFSY